jgi:hypothetical protein
MIDCKAISLYSFFLKKCRLTKTSQNTRNNYHVSFHDISEPQILSDLLPVSVLEELLHLDAGALDKVGARMNVGAVDDQLAQVLEVGLVHAFRISQNFCDIHGDSDLMK